MQDSLTKNDADDSLADFPVTNNDAGDSAQEQAPAPVRSLPPGFRPNPWRLAVFAIGCLLSVLIYSLFGTDSETEFYGTSIFAWFAQQWGYEDFAHNWVMLLFAGLVVWIERRRIAEAQVSPHWAGVAVVAVSIFAHIVGYWSQMPRISLGSFACVIWGLVLAVWGKQTARALLFPIGYCLLCFMGYILVEFTMPLRLMASSIAAMLLRGVGIATTQQGTVVFSSAGGGFVFNVADPCSGLRSLITMTALAAPYAYFTLKSNGKRLFLFALSIPLAMLANALRIFTLGLVAEWIGMNLAMQLYHDLSGYIVFILSILLLVAAGSLVDRKWRLPKCMAISKR